MPQIPTLDNRVQVSNLPSVRIQAFDTGAQAIGQGLNNLSSATMQIAQRERQRADSAQLLEADTAMAELEDTLFHDPENGAYAKRGKDALSAPDSLWPEWEKREGEIRGKLPPHLQGQFGQFANSRRRDLSRSLTRHITQESDKYYGELAESYITTSSRSAAANYTDPERIDTEVARALIGIEGAGILEGKPEEWVKAKRQEIESRVRSGALERMLTDDPISAQAYYDKHKESILPEQQNTFERLLKPLVMGVKVKEEAAKYAGMDYLDALKSAREIADPDLQAGVLKEIEFGEKIRVETKRRADEQITEDISGAIETASPLLPMDEILSPNQLAWAQENGKVAAIESRLKQRIEGLQPKTDYTELSRLDALITQAQDGDAKALQALRDESPVDWYGKLDRQMWEHQKERRAAILNAGVDKEAAKKAAEIASETELLKYEVYQPLGIPSSGKLSTKQEELRGQFQRAYIERKEVFAEQNGRAPTGVEQREIMRELLQTRTVVEPGIFFDSNVEVRAFQTNVEIPATDRASIREAYRAVNGREPSEDEVQAMYFRARN